MSVLFKNVTFFFLNCELNVCLDLLWTDSMSMTHQDEGEDEILEQKLEARREETVQGEAGERQ